MNHQYRPLLDVAADVDVCWSFYRREWSRGQRLGDLSRLLGDLRSTPFDWVIDFQGLLRSGLLASFAKGARKVGFDHAREGAAWSYDVRIPVPPALPHAVDRNLFLLGSALGFAPQYEAPQWRFPPAVVAAADALATAAGARPGQPLVAVAPATRWPSKAWPPAFFAETLTRLAAASPQPFSTWLAGGKDEVAVGDAVLAAGAPPATVNLSGRTDMPTLLALLRRSTVLLTNDSGAMHLATAVGTPVVALFGPTDPALTGPYGPGHHTLHTRVPCSPCRNRVCPLPRQLCRDDVISPALAAAALLQVLTAAPGASR